MKDSPTANSAVTVCSAAPEMPTANPHSAGGFPTPWRSLAGLAVVACVSGCVGEASPHGSAQRLEERPISGGYDDDGDPAVVAVVALFGGASICSGTLISPNVVLTAQHCVAKIENKAPNGGVDCSQSTFGDTHAPNFFQYTTNSVLSFDTSIYRPIAEMIVPPQANWACGYDIALVRLADPVDPSVAIYRRPRVDEPLVVPTPHLPASGEEYSAVGFGEATDGGGDSGRRRRRDGLFATCGEGNCFGGASLFMTQTEWLGDTGVCQGDSGGPAFDVHGRVIGVADRGGAECTSPIYASVYAWREWIKQEVIAAAQAGGIEPPPWATGWPTHPDFNHAIGDVCGSGETCPSGSCIQGVCSRKCNDKSPCGRDFFCNSEGMCELASVGGTCEVASECAGGECDQGRCTRRCFNDLWSCPQDWFCATKSGLCEPQPVGLGCDADADCEGGSCVEGLCTRACGELGCPDGWRCDGVCVLLPVGDACDNGVDCVDGGSCLPMVDDPDATGRCSRGCGDLAPCPNGWACDDQQCVLASVGGDCSADTDCAAGATCGADNYCTRGCDALAPCPVGYSCGRPNMEAGEVAQCVLEPPAPVDAGCASSAIPGGLPWAPVAGLTLVVVVGMRRRRRSQALDVRTA